MFSLLDSRSARSLSVGDEKEETRNRLKQKLNIVWEETNPKGEKHVEDLFDPGVRKGEIRMFLYNQHLEKHKVVEWCVLFNDWLCPRRTNVTSMPIGHFQGPCGWGEKRTSGNYLGQWRTAKSVSETGIVESLIGENRGTPIRRSCDSRPFGRRTLSRCLLTVREPRGSFPHRLGTNFCKSEEFTDANYRKGHQISRLNWLANLDE